MDKISVITPIYKVEDYLEKCINSIINQTYKNLEIILVDDGSPDNCGLICDDFAKQDNRIKVIHKKNGGAPSARNAGIEVATGDYFYFPDSDDWLEPTYIEDLYNSIVKTNSQLAISGFTMEYYEKNKSTSYKVCSEFANYHTKVEVRNNIHKYLNNTMLAVPWNKLYKARYINENNLRFPNLKWDDLHFNMEVVKDIDNIVISDSTGYHFFRSRPGSESTKVYDSMLYQKRKEQFSHILSVYSYWNINDGETISCIYGYYYARIIQLIIEISISKIKNKDEQIHILLNDDFTKKAIKFGKLDSNLLRIFSFVVKKKNETLCLVFGKLVGLFKNKFSNLFYKLKYLATKG